MPASSAIPEDDRALVARMAAGDEMALGTLYDRWHCFANNVIGQILDNQGDVEDVVEASFWQAWQQAGRFDETRGSVGAWIFSIARSRALDRGRAVGRRREDRFTEIDDAGRHLRNPVTRPDVAVEESERSARVLNALAGLPALQRESLHLGYFDGLSQSEIAERLGLPLGTVKTRMRLGLQKLRGTLHELREPVDDRSSRYA